MLVLLVLYFMNEINLHSQFIYLIPCDPSIHHVEWWSYLALLAERVMCEFRADSLDVSGDPPYEEFGD